MVSHKSWCPTRVQFSRHACSTSFWSKLWLDALGGFEVTIKAGGRTITNLSFADDLDLLAGSRRELADLTKRLDLAAKKYRMETSGEKSKIMVTSKRRDANRYPRQIQINRCTLKEVKSFQPLGSTVTEDVTSQTEVKKRLATATGAARKAE